MHVPVCPPLALPTPWCTAVGQPSLIPSPCDQAVDPSLHNTALLRRTELAEKKAAYLEAKLDLARSEGVLKELLADAELWGPRSRHRGLTPA